MNRKLLLLLGLLILASLAYLSFRAWQSLTAPKISYELKKAPTKTGFAFLNENKVVGFKVLLGREDSPKVPQARFEVKNSWIDFSLALNLGENPFKKTTVAKAAQGTSENNSPSAPPLTVRGGEGGVTGRKDMSSSGTSKDKDLILWENVLTDTNIQYQLNDDGLKEEIILKDKTLAKKAVDEHELFTLPFYLTTYNVVPRYDLSGKLAPVFIDSQTGEYRFHLETPFIVDAKGARYEAVEFELRPLDLTFNSKDRVLSESEGRVEGKPLDVALLPGSSGLFVESNPHEKKSDSSQGNQNLNIGANSPEVAHSSNFSSQKTVNSKNIIPQRRWSVNGTNSSIVRGNENWDPINTVPNSAAAKLINSPDQALSQALENNLSMSPSYQNPLIDQAFAAESNSPTPPNNAPQPPLKVRGGEGELRGVTGSRYLLVLKLPREWLTDSSRSYPVVIDPSITHNTQTAFATGTLNRVKDEGSADASPSLTSAYHELPADINTVGLWHMNEASGTSVADSSGNSNTGTATGTTVVAGKLGNARSFNGSSDYIVVSSSGLLNPTLDYTIEAWVYPNSTSNHKIYSQGNTGNDNPFINLEIYNGNISYAVRNDALSEISITGQAITTGQWSHVAVTKSGSTYTLYLNGVGTSTQSTTPASPYSFNTSTIGLLRRATPCCYFNGIIDELRISNVARTPEELKANAQRHPYSIYTSPVMDLTNAVSWTNLTWLAKGVRTGDGETPISTSGLVAQWNFNSTSGTTATADAGSCGVACNATLTNFANTTGQDVAAGSGWTSANRRWGSGALMFDGSNDYVSIPDSSSLIPTTAVTVEAWIKRTGTHSSGNANIYDKRPTTNDAGYILDGVDARFYIHAGGSWTSTSKSGATPADGLWHYFVGTYDGSAIKAYVDGVLVNSVAKTGTITSTTANSMIGATVAGGCCNNYFIGVIDSVKVYSRALTASEILANYQAGNIEFQTRTSADNATWEAWKPVTGEAAVLSMDNDVTPDAISGIRVWLKADAITGVSNGAQFGTWSDSSGVVNNFTQATGSRQPTYVTNVLNGKPVVRFTASASQTMTNATNFTTPVSVIYVVRQTGGANQRMLSGVANNWLLGYWSGGKRQSYFEGWNTAAGSPATDTNWHIYSSVQTTSNSSAWEDGVQFVTSSTAGITGPNGLSLSGHNAATEFSNGDIAELLVYNRALPDDERRIIENYLANKYALGLNSPIRYSTDTTTKLEGTGSEKLEVGRPQVDANTVGLWHLEETSGTGAYIKDATANANHGTPTGTTVVDGFYGKARSFTANTDVVSISSISLSGISYTIETWFYYPFPASPSGWNTLTRGVNNDHQVIVQRSDMQLGMFDNAGGTGFNGSGFVMSSLSNGWHHFAAVGSGTTTAFYIDGVYKGTSNKKSNAEISYIGNFQGGSQQFGTIDEVRISNTARTAEEIAEAYRAGRDHRVSRTITSTDLSGKSKLPFYIASDRAGTFAELTACETAFSCYEPDTNTVGQWHLEEQTGSGAYIKDSSGNGNNGTPTGTSFVQGKIGKARSFTANSTDVIQLANSVSLNGVSYTIDAWSYFPLVSNTGGWRTLTRGINNDHQILVDVNGYLGVYDNAGATGFHSSGYNINSLAGWHHLAAVVNGSNTDFYIDGVKVGSSNFKSNAEITFLGNCSANCTQAWGIVDEVRISNTARTADEIRQAYEVGRRTHPVTIDFKSSLAATNLITGSGDLSFDLGCTIASLTNCSIVKGETIIVKENVGGTEYIAQGEVTATSGSTVTVGQWNSGSTFPTGGFTANATVFKWQREYFDLKGILASHVDAVTRLTWRVTDGSQGANVWLDDFRSSGGYLTDNTPDSFNTTTGEGTYSVTGASIASTLNRYFQYRALIGGWDTPVSPQLTSATLNWVSNSTPAAPTISAPTNGATGISLTPSISMSTTDADLDKLQYKLQIATDAAFSQNLQTFDQSASPTDLAWGGRNATISATNDSYTSGSTATYTIQTALSQNVTYYLRAYAVDPQGLNLWSNASSTVSFTTAGKPSAPTPVSPVNNTFRVLEPFTDTSKIDSKQNTYFTPEDKAILQPQY